GDLYPSEIAARILVAPNLVTSDLQRLLAAGLAVRKPDEKDRRRIGYHVTDKGGALLDEMHRLYASRIDTRLATYAPAELATFFNVLERMSKESWPAPEGC